MPADQPFVRHEGTVVLLMLLFGFLTTPVLILYGVRGLLRARQAVSRAAILVAGSVLAWAMTIGLYTWGLLHLFIADDYTEARACDAALGKSLVGYDPSFVPLRFDCIGSDGHTASVVVPSYINPVLAVLVVCAVTLTAFAIVRTKERTP
ncbi:hypothetical protein [Kitasatospora sp. CB01950]|uniref:hypothetical protein n=1 Tax=Kitasatospora sp. CB01950 TaxID=1703930 RepID=UPI00093CDBFE|nr:hypothetical protein [Kitasatospora sp. CB01950]OKJ16697.1 hypothetical protein AMK19_00395 [Kitasatospora sp. CB01950]